MQKLLKTGNVEEQIGSGLIAGKNSKGKGKIEKVDSSKKPNEKVEVLKKRKRRSKIQEEDSQ